MKIFITILILFSFNSWAKVDPPNYDFSLKKFEDFIPGQKLSEVEKKYPKAELYNGQEDYKVYKYYIAHLRYKFPLFVQYYKGEVTDYFARLPSYFLHNVFHQSIINRIGAQNEYKKYEESTVYTWNNIKGNKHIYFGSCTILCFPVYYTVLTNKKPNDSFRPLIEQFKP